MSRTTFAKWKQNDNDSKHMDKNCKHRRESWESPQFDWQKKVKVFRYIRFIDTENFIMEFPSVTFSASFFSAFDRNDDYIQRCEKSSLFLLGFCRCFHWVPHINTSIQRSLLFVFLPPSQIFIRSWFSFLFFCSSFCITINHCRWVNTLACVMCNLIFVLRGCSDR